LKKTGQPKFALEGLGASSVTVISVIQLVGIAASHSIERLPLAKLSKFLTAWSFWAAPRRRSR